MAGVALQTYQTNTAWNTWWYIYNSSFSTDLLSWAVTVLIKERVNNVEGVAKDLGSLLVVGMPPAVDPSPGVVSVINEFVRSQTGTAEYSSEVWWNCTNSNYLTRGPYRYWISTYGSVGFGSDEVDYTFDSTADFLEALDNGEIYPIRETAYFDIYVNGTDKPSLFVNWTAPDYLSPVIAQPRVWLGCDALVTIAPEFITDETTGLQIPNAGAWYVDNMQSPSYAGSMDTTYLSVMEVFEKYLNPVSKVEMWGFDGVPACVRFYLRLDYGDEIGELWRAEIDVNGSARASAVSSSGNAHQYWTRVRFHVGEPDYVPPQDDDDYARGTNITGDDTGKYDSSDIPDPDDFTTPAGFDGNGVLTTTYAVSAATLRNIGQKLWSQDYFNVLKIQNNPIENIVSVKHYPFALTGTAQEVKVGDVAFGVTGDKVASVHIIPIGSYTYTGHFNNYLDLAPFTVVKIFLPYCGMFQLDPADILGCKIGVRYYVDLVTGQCMARLFLDENSDGNAIPYMSVYGNMGIDIPLTSTDRVQTEIRATGAAISALGSMAGHMIGGDALGAAVSGATGALNIAGADYTSQRTTSQSPVCACFDTQDVFIMIERPASEYVETGAKSGYKHLHGLPSNKYKSLSSFPAGSFIQVDGRTDINIGMTADENRMLEELLTKGVYI